MLTAKKKEERIQGKTFLMSPAGMWHNKIGMNLARIIGNYLWGKRCEVFYESKVVFDEENHFIPDLIIVCDRAKIKYGFVQGAPDLVIEILSPSTRTKDAREKKAVYEKFGVKEYWLVDPISETIDVYLRTETGFVLDNTYHNYSDEEWEALDEEERAEAMLLLKVSLYDDLVIDVKDVFRKYGE